jgi:WD40 repeat protein
MGLVLDTKFAVFLKIKKRLYQAGYWQALLSVNRKIRDFLKIKKNMHSDLIVRPADGKSAVIRVSPQGKVTLVLSLEHMSTPSHSLLPLEDDSVIYLNTTEGKVIHFDPQGKNLIKSNTKVTDGFLRGVTLLSNGNLILGSKGEILVFDLIDAKVLSTIRITSDPDESVYDIKILPDHFSIPPLSLEEQINKICLP